MNEEKKDNSASWINYHTDHTKQELEREKKAVNEDTNKAKGQKIAEIGDATGGAVKTPKEHLKAGEEQKGKSYTEKHFETKTPSSRLKEVGATKEVIFDKTELHLKPSTALTDSETEKGSLKGADKTQIGKETTAPNQNFRGNAGGRGGAPMMKEPDEILKEKNDAVDPKDILSKKQDGKQQKQESQQQQAQHKSASPKLNPREWMAKTLDSNSPKETEQEKRVAVAKDRGKTNIKGLIDKSIAEKENAPNPKTNSKEKNKEIAMNSSKSPSPKSIKR